MEAEQEGGVERAAELETAGPSGGGREELFGGEGVEV